MRNLIAVRMNSYKNYEHLGWAHLPQIGIRHVEIECPGLDQVPAVKKRLADHGLTATSLHDKCHLDEPEVVEKAKPILGACAELGAKICFLSGKTEMADRVIVYERLRAIGDAAAACGVTVSLETHPPLITNGDLGRQTMEAIDHPNVRINFDTANIYYYNQGGDAVTELTKVLDYVASVHLKDTNGKYQDFHFPTLGEGVVDFPGVLGMLCERGFSGPYTLELEGIEGIELDEAGQLAHVADSVAYLRRIGAFGEGT